MPTSTQSLSSGGKRIRVHITEPGLTPNAPGPFPAVLLLHGAGGNIDFWLSRIAPTLQQLGIAIYAVHYFDSTGAQHASPALLADGVSIPVWLQTIRDTLAWISSRQTASRPSVDARRIALVGISLGAFLSLALGTEAAEGARIRAIAEISGGLIPPWDAQATSAYPPTLILHGEADPVVPVSHARALDALLTRLAVPHQLQTFPTEGHWFSLSTQARILELLASFLKEHL